MSLVRFSRRLMAPLNHVLCRLVAVPTTSRYRTAFIGPTRRYSHRHRHVHSLFVSDQRWLRRVVADQFPLFHFAGDVQALTSRFGAGTEVVSCFVNDWGSLTADTCVLSFASTVVLHLRSSLMDWIGYIYASTIQLVAAVECRSYPCAFVQRGSTGWDATRQKQMSSDAGRRSGKERVH